MTPLEEFEHYERNVMLKQGSGMTQGQMTGALMLWCWLERQGYAVSKTGQQTKCAVCLGLKHTPLRVDHMGGYVCLTCIDKELHKPQPWGTPLKSLVPEMLEALKGVVRVADRKTVEFDAARAAIARAEGRQ